MKIPIPFFPRAIVIRVEPDRRTWTWPRFSIRGLMIAIALLAVGFGVVAYRRAEVRRQALAAERVHQIVADMAAKVLKGK